MTLDENVAAFGMLQFTFANLVERFAEAVFYIQRINEPTLQFREVFARNFESLRDQLKKELKQFDNRALGAEIADVRRACSQAGHLAAWRNPRIHPRVKWDPQKGIAIYDAKTGKPLAIKHSECTKRIEESVSIAMTLDSAVGAILKDVQDRKDLARMVKEVLQTEAEKTA